MPGFPGLLGGCPPTILWYIKSKCIGVGAVAWEWRKGQKTKYLTIPEWERVRVEVAFSGRNGGVSGGPYDSLNLGLHVGDQEQDVLENRRRFWSEWGARATDVVVGEQVHSNKVVWVGENDKGRGAMQLSTALPGVDGMLTGGGMGLMAFFADCVPVYFFHPGLKVVGLAHAGWKGTAGRIGIQVLNMLSARGGEPGDCWVAIGPGIGRCCYEVDERVAREFPYPVGYESFLAGIRPGHFRLDLAQANREMLIKAGVAKERIWLAGLCTSCHPGDFFSYRRDGGTTGRMAAWIRLREE